MVEVLKYLQFQVHNHQLRDTQPNAEPRPLQPRKKLQSGRCLTLSGLQGSQMGEQVHPTRLGVECVTNPTHSTDGLSGLNGITWYG